MSQGPPQQGATASIRGKNTESCNSHVKALRALIAVNFKFCSGSHSFGKVSRGEFVNRQSGGICEDSDDICEDDDSTSDG